MRRLRWTLTVNSTDYEVNPLFGDDLYLALDRVEKGQYALREVLEGQLIFKREDYDLIFDAAHTLATRFQIALTIEEPGTTLERIAGYFHQNYGKNDEDNRQFKIERLGTTDMYEAIVNGATREFNLPDLGAPRYTVQYKLQPLIQMYHPGDSFLTNINGGNSWEQPVQNATSSQATLENDYFFLKCQTVYYIPGRTILDPDIGGEYTYNSGLGEYENGNYDIRLDGGDNTWKVYDILNSDLLVYTGTPGETDINATTFTEVGGDAQTAKFYTKETYMRILSNAATIDGSPTDPIPAADIVAQNDNYTTVIGYNYLSFWASDSNSDTPTPYGEFAEDSIHFAGKYFDFPANNIITENFFPLAPSSWEYYSIWTYFNTTMKDIVEDEAEVRTVRDAYKYADVLAAILQQLDPSITHEETDEYSDFMYGASNPIRGKRTYPFLTAKTNITVGDYDLAAKKAPVSLQDLQKLALRGWRCPYYVDSDGKYIYEHVSYFEKGKSYTSPNEGIDLTTQVQPQQDSAWSTGTNETYYDLDEIPEEIQTDWGEQTSAVFDGLPIKITADYATPGGTDQDQLNRFIADIDFALANEVNRDGLIYMECDLEGGEYIVRFEQLNFRGKNYKLQNGVASFAYMDWNFGRYGLPAEDVTINGTETTALSAAKTRRQELDFLTKEDGTEDYLELVRTSAGLGELTTAKVQLTTGIVEQVKLNLWP